MSSWPTRTRDLISAAARRQFAERCYQRTTMRSIAAEADVDPSAVTDPEVAALIRERHRHDILLLLVRDLGADRAELRLALAATQVTGLVIALSVLKLDVLVDLGDEELTALVAPALRRYLNQPLEPEA
ncbi:MAG: TetR family transcriptional regulator [Trebonia sp.]